MALTILGIVIGLTALVATMGLSRTASNRIISQFDELAATGIVVTAKPGPTGVDPKVIPWDAADTAGTLEWRGCRGHTERSSDRQCAGQRIASERPAKPNGFQAGGQGRFARFICGSAAPN